MIPKLNATIPNPISAIVLVPVLTKRFAKASIPNITRRPRTVTPKNIRTSVGLDNLKIIEVNNSDPANASIPNPR